MIQGIFWKWVFKKIYGLIEDANDDRIAKSHHKRIKALEKESRQTRKNGNKNSKYTEALEKEVAILKINSHPSQEYICCRKCGCEIAKSKGKISKKKIKKIKKEK